MLVLSGDQVYCDDVAGPMLLIYFLLLDLPVVSIIATLNWLFIGGKTVQSLLMAQRGALDASVLQAALPVAAVGVAFYFAGLRLRQRAARSVAPLRAS